MACVYEYIMTRKERKKAIENLEKTLKECCPSESIRGDISVHFIGNILTLVDSVIVLEEDFNKLAGYYYSLFEGDIVHIDDAMDLMRKHHLVDKDDEWIEIEEEIEED